MDGGAATISSGEMEEPGGHSRTPQTGVCVTTQELTTPVELPEALNKMPMLGTNPDPLQQKLHR